MAKKKTKVKAKPQPKQDPQLAELQATFMRHQQESERQRELAHQAAQAFADRAAELAGLAIGDYIAVSSYGREIPAQVQSFYASNNDWRDDDKWRRITKEEVADLATKQRV